jgi:hypothetical protein
MNPDDLIITTNDVDTYYSIGTSDTYDMDLGNVATSSLKIFDDDTPTEVEIQQGNGETLMVGATIRQQKYEIEALTDIIKEMVKTKNFDVELDIEKRVEQKKFLKRLGED